MAKPMSRKDRFREWVSDNLRYMLLILAIVAVVGLGILIVHLVTSGSDDGEAEPKAEVTATLRASGVSADMDIMGRKMAKALKFASSARARYAVIIGAKEMEQGSVTLRDMSTGEQTLVKVEELSGKIVG